MHEAAFAATQIVPASIGRVIAERYELKGFLGQGGMGTVFRAHDRELDEDVALKVLHHEFAEDAASLRRFRREVKLARRVTHRNVARTFDVGSFEGLRFLTMELILGEHLSKRAEARPLPLPEALRISAEIARGLAAAHVVGVVHRDLKPENVMLNDERVVLTDFGIARAADGSADAMRTGTIVGTPAYMAPEQLDNQAIDGRTDIYALGTILFQLLSGRLPFLGDTAMSLAAQRLSGDAPDLRSIGANVPDAVAALVSDMLLRRRESRPAAQAVLDRIEALRGNAARVGLGASRIETMRTTASIGAIGRPSTVAVEALVGEPAALAGLLTSAIADALTEARLATIVEDPDAADLALGGTVHSAGEAVRVRLRLVGRKGRVWAGHVDGTAARSLELEDQVVLAALEAVRSGTLHDPGPADPSLRDGYDKAKKALVGFVLPSIRSAVAILEEMEASKPGDPRVRTLLARAILAAWGQTGASDRGTLARAEDLALRALQDDPTLANAHHVIAHVRSADGELAAALRADEECLRLDPRHAGAHEHIGSLMCESLHVSEGRQRIELAMRLEPDNPMVRFAALEIFAMIETRERTAALLAEMEARCGSAATMLPLTRLAMWWDDRALAGDTAERIEAARAGASWDAAAGILRSMHAGVLRVDAAAAAFSKLTSSEVAPRHRSFLHEVAADYYGRMGRADDALAHVVAASRLPFTNLLWLDRSPPLALVRDDPRFARARATTASRCAELWGAVGSWPD